MTPLDSEYTMADKHEMMNSGNLKKALAWLAAPAIVGMIVQTLYGIVDSIFVGRGLGDDGVLGLAALAVAFPVSYLLICVGSGVAVGGSSFISRGFGAADKERVQKGIGNMIFMALAASVFCTIAGLLFLDPLLTLFGATETNIPFARDYMFWIILGCVFQIMTITLNSVVMAQGNSVYSMTMYTVTSLINVVLDYIFIFEFGWGVKGAAIATVLCQILNVAILIFYLYKVSKLNFRLKWIRFDRPVFSEIGKIGISEFLREGSLVFTFIIIVWNLNYYGNDTHIAIYGLINRIFGFVFIPAIGIVQGMIPLAGFNYGAKNFERVRKIVKISLVWAIGILFVLTAITYLFTSEIFTLFIPDNPELVKEAVIAYWIADLMIPIIAIQVIGSAFMQALGKAKASFVLAVARQVIMIPIMVIFPYFFGLVGVWIAYPVTDLLASALTLWFVVSQLKSLKNEEKLSEKYKREGSPV
ncbi:MAG: MATE family efflux transporter [Methanimicrococcus sp.]|nr:MATE family efflux transporter [Methanimicrococcus sp.]